MLDRMQKKTSKLATTVAGLGLALASLPALAQVTVSDAWARGTVAQQTASGAFMRIRSAQPARLVAVESPAAGRVEVHEMAMQDGVMRMRAVAGLDLAAGQEVELKPGGFHLMLMDLKAPLKAGDSIDLTLVIEAKDGAGKAKRERLRVKAAVRALGSAAAEK